MYINGSSTPVNQRRDVHNTTCPQCKQSEDRYLILCVVGQKDCRTGVLELRLKGLSRYQSVGQLEKSVLGRGNMCKVRKSDFQKRGRVFLKRLNIAGFESPEEKLRMLCRESYNYKIQPFETLTNSLGTVKN